MEKNDLKFLILFFYYNRPEMVLNAIKSLNKNTYKNFEIAFIDDGSDQRPSIQPTVVSRRRTSKWIECRGVSSQDCAGDSGRRHRQRQRAGGSCRIQAQEDRTGRRATQATRRPGHRAAPADPGTGVGPRPLRQEELDDLAPGAIATGNHDGLEEQSWQDVLLEPEGHV